MEYQEYLGSLDFIHTLLNSIDEAAKRVLPSSSEIIVVKPGGKLTLEDFLYGGSENPTAIK
jgi:hypothetical protein